MSRISLQYLFVITLVMAVTATAIGWWLKLSNGEFQWMPGFFIATAVAPLLLMTIVYWVIRWVKSRMS